MDFDVEKRAILLTKHGSHAYGTNIETSDLDVKGVAIPPKDYFLGYAYAFEQKEQAVSKGHDEDKVIYGIQKFIKLAADCNPNICEVLFTDEKDWLFVDKFGRKLIENNHLFISKKAKYAFSGYAFAQLKRIKTHRNWLLNPPQKEPERKDFGLSDNVVINKSNMGTVDELKSKGYKFDENVVSIIQKEKAYANAMMSWKQYHQWKENRNKARAETEAKFGFDVKHGMHLMRLMRMCVEILEGKGVIVKRPDAKELLEIRNGLWSYDRLIEEAEKLVEKANELYVSSTLPKNPPVKKINDLCVELVETYIKENG